MADQKTSMPPDLTALAAEACELWQEHLSACATDPKAKAELMKLLEPSRQLFAQWAAMMQHGAHANPFGAKFSAGPAPFAASPGDGPHGMAGLAARLDGLEERVARLETGAGGAPAKAAGPRKRKS